MKQIFSLFLLLILVFSLGIHPVIACTVNFESLRKNFRHAKRVFLGEIVAIDSINIKKLPKEIQEQYKDYKVLSKITFKVERSWKGNDQKEVIAYSTLLCFCPYRTEYYSIGKKFLMFSDKQSYFDACNLLNMQVDSSETEFIKYTIERLDSFWFRTWAKIYPF